MTAENPSLETYGERFLKAIDYYGFVEVEFKFDTRDQQFELHDVNLRTWGFHSLGRWRGLIFRIFSFLTSSVSRWMYVALRPASHGFAP